MKRLVVVVSAAIALEVALGLLGLRFNASPSMPYGFYWVSSPADLEVGDLVIACAPATSQSRPAPLDRCPQGRHALLKRISRLKGGAVWLTGEHSQSWDSRHYGALDQRQLVRRATPLLTWRSDR